MVGDISGNAKILVPLTFDLSTLTDEVDVAVGAQCSATEAATTLKFPCGGWNFTPTWVGLQLAYNMLYPFGDSRASARKVVFVLTGAHATYAQPALHMCSSHKTGMQKNFARAPSRSEETPVTLCSQMERRQRRRKGRSTSAPLT